MSRFAQPDANLAGEFGVIFNKQEVHGVRESMLHDALPRRHLIWPFITKR
jgi:hypothetical protein